MHLINYLSGPFNEKTPEGRGANAAFNTIVYIEECTQKSFFSKHLKFLAKKEDELLEKLSNLYIPYSGLDEETKMIDLRQGFAFAAVYLKLTENNSKNAVETEQSKLLKNVLDFVEPSKEITPGKFLSWLIFQDCTEIMNGVLSPNEILKSMVILKTEPEYVKTQLSKIYYGFGIDKLEKEIKINLRIITYSQN